MLWLTIFALGLLAATVFLRHIMIYIALIVAWCGIIFWIGPGEFPDYIKLAAVAVVVFGIMGIKRARESG